MSEINKTINGYHIYIGGTWCEVTKDGNHIYDGSVEEGMTAEEVYKQIREMEGKSMNKLEFLVNNNSILNMIQNEADGMVCIKCFDCGTKKNEHLIDIPAGDMVMLLNLYKYVKENDVQNDFINPYGKNKE